MYFSGGFGTPLWWIFPIIMIIFCFFMMRGCMGGMRFFKGNSHIEPTYSALEILGKRYASGEIDKDEYEQMKRDLSNSNDQDRLSQINA